MHILKLREYYSQLKIHIKSPLCLVITLPLHGDADCEVDGASLGYQAHLVTWASEL